MARPRCWSSRGGSGTGTSLSGAGREAEATTDTNGEAAVRLVQQDPKPGKTRVAVEIVKPPETGTGAGTVVARRETTVEWAAPQIGLTVTAPPAAGVGGTYPVTVALDNAGSVDSKDCPREGDAVGRRDPRRKRAATDAPGGGRGAGLRSSHRWPVRRSRK